MKTPRTSLRIACALGIALLAVSGSARPAAAVQASGSLIVVPSNWGLLATNDVIDVAIAARNSSSDTPAVVVPDGTGDVQATLGGAIMVMLACADPTCSTQVPGKLAFVPVGGNGCVSNDPAVSSCASGGGDNVLITLSSPITLPPGGTVPVATVRVRVVDATGVTQLGISAHSDPASLTACSTNAPSVCAMCMADGCTKVVFVQNVNVGNCPHACPSRIRFLGDAARPDFIEFHGIVTAGANFDPNSAPFTISLSNAQFNPIFSLSLPAGSFNQQGSVFTFNDNSAAANGGIAFVRISQRDGQPDAWKVDIQAFDANLQSRATLPDMTFDFSAGGQTFSVTATWDQRSFGWQLNELP
ncbi:MAG TPA: hypothetical protein VFD92_09705 [Candidatus Binatia bacterium]|nr:hypothetical protein [Candidatus Binatia bacterium]